MTASDEDEGTPWTVQNTLTSLGICFECGSMISRDLVQEHELYQLQLDITEMAACSISTAKGERGQDIGEQETRDDENVLAGRSDIERILVN